MTAANPSSSIAPNIRIIITNPTAVNLHPDLISDSVREYAGGKNYHKFAIFDPNESEDLLRFRVLRNHYYEFTVTNFTKLGSHTSDVNPAEPIPTTTTVDVQVTVKNWDRVSSGIEL